MLKTRMSTIPANSAAEWHEVAVNAQNANQLTEAAAAWRELLWLRPDDVEALAGLAACGEVKAAIEGLQRLLRQNPDHKWAHHHLGLVWLELAEWDKAEHELQQGPEGEETEVALERLRAARGQPGSAYARHLFNDYAPRFEEALAKLGYQAPQLIAKALQPYLKTDQRIIDLGCGTGLMVPYLKPYAARLVGVDIAEKMLEQAAQRGQYDQLVAADMVEALRDEYDIIVAADAVVYVGDLQPLFKAAAGALAEGGVFALSVEVNGLGEGYRLQESKRHAHSPAYLHKCAQAAGLQIVSMQEATLRQDRGQPVLGAILIVSPTKVADLLPPDGL